MQRFELGVAYRGSVAPEMKRFVEAGSMREAAISMGLAAPHVRFDPGQSAGASSRLTPIVDINRMS